MSTPTVSVLIGVHNGEATLDRCLTSVGKQSYRSWQIVIVDDASTDGTRTLLGRWKRCLGTKLRVLRNEENLGLTKSLNTGLATIATRYVARIDADDWWHAEKLAKQLAFLRTHPAYGVIGCNYINVGAKGERQVVLWEDDAEIRRRMIQRNPFAHSCVVFRTELVRALGGYDTTIRYAQDYDLWWRCRPKTKFYNLQEVLCFRSVGRGISVAKQRHQMLQGVRTQVKYIRVYRLPVWSYLCTLELLAIALTPAFIRDLKRRLVG